MKYRVGIVGMGKMGRIRKRDLDAHPGFEVVALCDINPAVAAEFPALRVTTAWEEVIAAEIDVVVICTYNRIAPTIVCAALARGMHVFCEKPPGVSVADVQQIIQAEKAAGDRVVKFGFNHRFHYSVMEAKALIDSGRYGQIMWARGTYGKAGSLDYSSSWRSRPDLAGGGILLDQGIHMLDLLRYFLGEFPDVKSFVEQTFWHDSPIEDNAFAMLRSAEGKVAMLHSSATHWKHKFGLDIFLENGYVCLNGILTSTRSYGEESITFAKRQFEDEARAFGRPREETIFFDTDDSWKLEIADFHACLSGEKGSPQGSTDDALKVMQLIETIYAAALWEPRVVAPVAKE